MENNNTPKTNPETESTDIIEEIDSVKQFIKETGLEKFTHLKGEEKTALTIRFLFGENSAEKEFSDRNIRLAASFASGEKRIMKYLPKFHSKEDYLGAVLEGYHDAVRDYDPRVFRSVKKKDLIATLNNCSPTYAADEATVSSQQKEFERYKAGLPTELPIGVEYEIWMMIKESRFPCASFIEPSSDVYSYLQKYYCHMQEVVKEFKERNDKNEDPGKQEHNEYELYKMKIDAYEPVLLSLKEQLEANPWLSEYEAVCAYIVRHSLRALLEESTGNGTQTFSSLSKDFIRAGQLSQFITILETAVETALKTGDPIAFSTYAFERMRESVLEGIATNQTLLALKKERKDGESADDQTIKKDLRKLKTTREELQKKLFKETITPEEYAAAMGKSVKKVNELLQIENRIKAVSSQTPISDDDADSEMLGDFIPDAGGSAEDAWFRMKNEAIEEEQFGCSDFEKEVYIDAMRRLTKSSSFEEPSPDREGLSLRRVLSATSRKMFAVRNLQAFEQAKKGGLFKAAKQERSFAQALQTCFQFTRHAEENHAGAMKQLLTIEAVEKLIRAATVDNKGEIYVCRATDALEDMIDLLDDEEGALKKALREGMPRSDIASLLVPEEYEDLYGKPLKLSEEEIRAAVRIIQETANISSASGLAKRLYEHFKSLKAEHITASQYIKRAVASRACQAGITLQNDTDNDVFKCWLLSFFLEAEKNTPQAKNKINNLRQGKVSFSSLLQKYPKNTLYKRIEKLVEVGDFQMDPTLEGLHNMAEKREFIFRLAFALGLDSDETQSELLWKAFSLPGIDFKNPAEQIASYCLDHHLSYADFQNLCDEYQSKTSVFDDSEMAHKEGTHFYGKEIEEKVSPDATPGEFLSSILQINQGARIETKNDDQMTDVNAYQSLFASLASAAIRSLPEYQAKDPECKGELDTTPYQMTLIQSLYGVKPLKFIDKTKDKGAIQVVRTKADGGKECVDYFFPTPNTPLVKKDNWEKSVCLTRSEICWVLFYMFSEEVFSVKKRNINMPIILKRGGERKSVYLLLNRTSAGHPIQSTVYDVLKSCERLRDTYSEEQWNAFLSISGQNQDKSSSLGELLRSIERTALQSASFLGMYDDEGHLCSEEFLNETLNTISGTIDNLSRHFDIDLKEAQKTNNRDVRTFIYRVRVWLDTLQSPLLGAEMAKYYIALADSVLSSARMQPVSFNDAQDVLLIYCIVRAYTDIPYEDAPALSKTPLDLLHEVFDLAYREANEKDTTFHK